MIGMVEMTERTFEMQDGEEFALILQSLGMQRSEAMIIAYLANAGEATSREIEVGTSLSQSEVSMKIRDLRGEKLIDERKGEIRGKGRPPAVYSLKTPLGEIIKRIEDEKQREHALAMAKIRKLRGLALS
ncbi:MAG TPA: ArsR family transcriptional regulator [Methanothrix soehngenii]|nr:ArsR family transcriptional regulator [Methanothrix soehngenii]